MEVRILPDLFYEQSLRIIGHCPDLGHPGYADPPDQMASLIVHLRQS
jgi:hypothetical protein